MLLKYQGFSQGFALVILVLLTISYSDPHYTIPQMEKWRHGWYVNMVAYSQSHSHIGDLIQSGMAALCTLLIMLSGFWYLLSNGESCDETGISSNTP